MLLLIGCRNNKYANLEQVLKVDTLITTLSDSSIYSNKVTFISCDGSGVYFTDYSAGNLIILNQDMVLQGKIGAWGDGPEELIGALGFCKDETSFYIQDEGNRSIKMYTSLGHYLQTINIPSAIVPAVWNRFVFRDSLFYLSSIGDALVSVIDKSGNFVSKFGVFRKDDIGGRILLSDESSIWTIGVASPVIEAYTYEGKLKKQFDYLNIPFVADYYSKRNNINNSFTVLVKDACIANGCLYIMILDKILCFSINNEIVLKQVYLLPHGHYKTFGVFEDQMYCFNLKKASIDRFNIGVK